MPVTVPDAVLLAVLRTLVRATADPRHPVVLRAARPAQARALARWLAGAHGTARVVIASTSLRGRVEVHLPPRVVWPPVGVWASPSGAQVISFPA